MNGKYHEDIDEMIDTIVSECPQYFEADKAGIVHAARKLMLYELARNRVDNINMIISNYKALIETMELRMEIRDE